MATGGVIMNERRQIISQFSSMTIDMDYMLCIPCIHAHFQGGETVIDISGGIRKCSGSFPEEKIELLRKWISLHREEILENHRKCGHSEFPLDLIEPYTE